MTLPTDVHDSLDTILGMHTSEQEKATVRTAQKALKKAIFKPNSKGDLHPYAHVDHLILESVFQLFAELNGHIAARAEDLTINTEGPSDVKRKTALMTFYEISSRVGTLAMGVSAYNIFRNRGLVNAEYDQLVPTVEQKAPKRSDKGQEPSFREKYDFVARTFGLQPYDPPAFESPYNGTMTTANTQLSGFASRLSEILKARDAALKRDPPNPDQVTGFYQEQFKLPLVKISRFSAELERLTRESIAKQPFLTLCHYSL